MVRSFILIACCWAMAPPAMAEPLQVFVSIPPQAYLVRRVAGEQAAVHVLVGAGQDPHTFQPTPRQLLALGRAKLFLAVGLPFEGPLLAKIKGQYPNLRIVDAAEGIQRRCMVGRCRHDHDAHGHHGHAHAVQPDPHVWLSLSLLEVLAQNTARAIRQADPQHEDVYHENLAELLGDIRAREAKISRLLAPHKGEAFYVFHPAFGYFSDAYGLKQEAVEVGGKSPTPKQLRAMLKKARADNVRVLFVQPQLDQSKAQAVARAVGATLVVVDPMAENPLAAIEDLATKVSRALK